MRKLLMCATALLLVASTQATIYYVTPEATAIATKTGVSSWANPVTLASAIDSASNTINDEVWIKGGTYAIHRAKTTNKAGIVINTGIKQIYGGFAGTETTKDQRLRTDLDANGNVEPWEFTNQTIFDGSTIEDYTIAYTAKQDLYSSLSTKPTITGSFLTPSKKTVLSFEGGANHIIDGIVIQNGKYDGDSYASGINIQVASTIRNCIVRKCSTTRVEDLTSGGSHSSAGALRIYGPSVVVDGCLIEDNTEGPLLPGNYNSGAVSLSEGTLKNSVVRNNISYVRSSSVAADGTVTGFAAGELATLGINAPATPVAPATTTNQNGNARAAGIYIAAIAAGKKVALVSNCIVANNEIVSYDPNSTGWSIYGAGITADNAGIITNCVVVNNKAGFANLNTSNALPTTALEGIGVYLRSSSNYTSGTPALQRPTIVSCYNTIALGNVGTTATLATKVDITMKGNSAFAPNDVAANVTTASILAPFSTREVKNCLVGGASINCDQTSSGAVVGNDFLATATSITFTTLLKTPLLTVPTACVYSQNAAAVLANPSTVVGYSATDASIKTANYKLKDATYAAAGTALNVQFTGYSSTNVPTVYTYTSPTADLLGSAFGTLPAIGAILSKSSVYSPTTVAIASADTLAPTAPTTLLNSIPTASSLTLSWTAATDNVGVTMYDIYKNGVLTGSTASTSFAFTGLTSATAYSFTVKAKDAAGNVSSASTALAVTTADNIAPNAPLNLQNTITTANSFTLSWSAATDNVAVTGYDVYKDGVLYGSTSTNSFTINGLTSTTAYSMTVKAKDAAGNISASSLTLTVTTADNIAPSTPLNLLNSTPNADSFILSWSASTDNVAVTGYNIFKDGILYGASTSTSLTINGLLPGTYYSMTVKAIDNSGNTSAASSPLSVFTRYSPVEIGMVSVSSNNKNMVVWNKPIATNIASFNIYRETNVSNVFEKVGTVPYDSMSIFVDTQSMPDAQSSAYKMSVYDRLGLESVQSNMHKTMHLSISKVIGTAWYLIWEPYEGFTVPTYNIYRGTTPTNMTLIGSTAGRNTQFSDLNAPAGNVYYQLEVICPTVLSPRKFVGVPQNSTQYSTSSLLDSYNSSRSNIASYVLTSLTSNNELSFDIYPNPSNGQVTLSFANPNNYSVLVSNSLGQKVYTAKLLTEKTSLNLSQYGKQGIYFVQITDEKGTVVGRKKVVVE